MGYTLAVFGQASLNKNLIFDTLADHFRFGPLDDEGYYTVSDETYTEGVELLIAVETAEAAEALDALNEWTARAGMNYTLVTASGLKAKNLAGDADRVLAVPDVPGRVAEELGLRSDDGHVVAVALAVEPGKPDESSRRLYNLLGGRVPTYSIGEGLLPVEPADYLTEAQAATREYVEQFEAENGPISREAKNEAREALEEITGDLSFASGSLLDLLGFLDAIDGTINAAEERCSHVHKLVDNLRRALALPEPEPPIAGVDEIGQDEPAPAPIEVEQVKPTKAKREWLDPSDNTWKPIGRGRPRKNVQIREVSA